MTFSPIGQLAQNVVEKAGSRKVVDFPEGATRQRQLAQSTETIEGALRQIYMAYGLIGAARVNVLLLIDLAYVCGPQPNAVLYEQTLKLAQFFKPEAAE
jgi:hypothetical protein